MATFIALLRGINVGGKNKMAMSDLRELATSLAFRNPRTVLQSGNLVFEAASASKPNGLEQKLELIVKNRLGIELDCVIRTASAWQKIIESNPFFREAEEDPGHLLLMCMKDMPAVDRIKTLQSKILGREIIRAIGPNLYLIYPDGIGRSKLTNAMIERELGVRGTARNWNTVTKLADISS